MKRSIRCSCSVEPLKPDLRGEIDGVDDQRLAFPVAARVAEQPGHAPVRTPIHRHDPRVVNHLVQNHDVIARLEELHVVVVDRRDHRWTRGSPENAPLLEREILGRLRGIASGAPARARRPARGLAPTAAESCRPAGSTISDVRLFFRTLFSRSHQSGPAVALLVLRRCNRLPFERGRLLVGQDGLVREGGGALQGRHGAEVPDAVEVRVAPRACGARSTASRRAAR